MAAAIGQSGLTPAAVGWLSLVLIGATTAVMITLAANAALAANTQVISVLRLVGARDSYIAQAFVRRFTLRAFGGSALGVLVGAAAILLLPSAQAEGGSDRARFSGA